MAEMTMVARPLLGIFVSLILGSLAHSKGPSVEDTIKRAQEKFLEEKRTEAMTILTQAMKAEKRDSNSFRKLSKALAQVTETFISEKAQQIFELARSLRKADPAAALDKLKTAYDLEPENEMVLRGMISILLGTGDCEKARDLVSRTLARNPFADVMMIYKIQSSLCLKSLETLRTDIAEGSGFPVETHKHVLAAQVELGQAVLQKNEGKLDSALRHLEKAQALEGRFAETRWLTHLILVDTKKVDLAPLKEYLEICERESLGKTRDSDLFPRSCVDQKLAKEELELRGKQ